MEKIPKYQPIPAWYELSSRDDGKALVLEVHPLALSKLEKAPWSRAPILSHLKDEYGVTDFRPPCNGDSGFNAVLKAVEPSREGWIAWSAALPVYKARPGQSKSDDGYEIAVRATLSVFSNSLWLFEGDTGYGLNQLMVIEAIQLPQKDRWMHNGGLGVTLTPDAVKWIAQQPDQEEIGPVVKAMKNAHDHMWQKDSDLFRYHAICRRPKWIHLDIPGDACGLDPDSHYDREELDQGYELVPHNADSGLQQLTFLAGLAKLHDLMRGR